jgi:hypothetical protein
MSTYRKLKQLELEIQTLGILIEADAPKEYPADWLKNVNTTLRDSSGRFASRSQDVAKSVGVGLDKSIQISRETLQKCLEEARSGASAIREYTRTSGFESLSKDLSGAVSEIGDGFRGGIKRGMRLFKKEVPSKQEEENILPTEDKTQSSKNRKRLLYTVAGVTFAAAAVAAAAAIYSAETRELKDYGASETTETTETTEGVAFAPDWRNLKKKDEIDSALDKGLNELGKFLRKDDIEKVRGDLQEYNNVLKSADIAKISFEESLKGMKVLSSEGITSNDVRDMLGREKVRNFARLQRKQVYEEQERFKELSTGKERDGKPISPEGEVWRKGLFSAEKKYGKLIDKALITDKAKLMIKDDYYGEEIYDKNLFLPELENSSTDKNFYKEFTKALSEGKSGQKTSVSSVVYDKSQRERIKESVEYAKEYSSYVNGDLHKVTIASAGKDIIDEALLGGIGPYMKPTIGLGHFDKYINIGTPYLDKNPYNPRTTIFHEMGHAVEVEKKLTPYTFDFIDNRKKVFYDPYISKKYEVLGIKENSEVISMATQQLSSGKAIIGTAKSDREHLLFGLWALDAKPK